MSHKKKLINDSGLPQEMIEQIARALLSDILDFYESAKGQQEYAEWKMEQTKKAGQGGEPLDAA